MEILQLFTQNLLSPPILFFVLGIIAGFLRSDLNVPEQISRYLAIYLMMAIGFKGGVAIAETPDIDWQVIATILAGIITGFTQPFIGYWLLKWTTKLDSPTAAAVSAHYGSISMVTFVTAVSFLETSAVIYAGYIVAVLALMEAPAILTGLFIAHRAHCQRILHRGNRCDAFGLAAGESRDLCANVSCHYVSVQYCNRYSALLFSRGNILEVSDACQN